jgi:hypothetical protein
VNRTTALTAAAISVTGIVIGGFAAISYHTVFFYTADGYMSPRTAARVGLLENEEALTSGGVAFRKAEGGGYDYRKEMATAFIDLTGHTDIDLLAECERLGDCELRKWTGIPHKLIETLPEKLMNE